MSLRVALVGLGDIAKKAYLPVLSEKEGIELILCTRNQQTLAQLAAKYRVRETYSSIEELINARIDVAFVSSATEAHYEMAKALITNGIHTYIDKPISLSLQQTAEIVELAQKHQVTAMVGFNRRFIPRVKELTEQGKPNLVLMQKNRFAAADYTRRFVVEDFIHVVDTLRFLMGTPVIDVTVQSLQSHEKLDQLVVQLQGENCLAIGIMNRNGGVTEETIEYHTGHHKYVVDSLVETTHYHNKDTQTIKFGDWEPTLYKRGFYQLVDHFLHCVATGETPNPSITDSLTTHEICERIVELIETR